MKGEKEFLELSSKISNIKSIAEVYPIHNEIMSYSRKGANALHFAKDLSNSLSMKELDVKLTSRIDILEKEVKRLWKKI